MALAITKRRDVISAEATSVAASDSTAASECQRAGSKRAVGPPEVVSCSTDTSQCSPVPDLSVHNAR